MNMAAIRTTVPFEMGQVLVLSDPVEGADQAPVCAEVHGQNIVPGIIADVWQGR